MVSAYGRDVLYNLDIPFCAIVKQECEVRYLVSVSVSGRLLKKRKTHFCFKKDAYRTFEVRTITFFLPDVYETKNVNLRSLLLGNPS